MSLIIPEKGLVIAGEPLFIASSKDTLYREFPIWHTGLGGHGLILLNTVGDILIGDGRAEVMGYKPGLIKIKQNVPGVAQRIGINFDELDDPAYHLHIRDNLVNTVLGVQRMDGATIFVSATDSYGQFGTIGNHGVRILANSTTKMSIGTDGVVSAPAIYTTPVTGGLTVYVDATGKLGYNACTEEMKTNIAPADPAKSKKILDLPVDIADFGDKIGATTLVLEKVKPIMPELCTYVLKIKTETGLELLNPTTIENYADYTGIEPDIETHAVLNVITPGLTPGSDPVVTPTSATIIREAAGIDYTAAVPAIIHTIQLQGQTIQLLQQQVANLEARILKLEGA